MGKMKSPEERREEFERYAQPIYIIEFDMQDYSLFPFQSKYYHKRKEDMIKFFDSRKNAMTLIEKDYTTGRQKIIRSKK